MKTTTFKSLGLNVNLNVPSTSDEFDSLAKKAGACVEEAVRNVVYRGSLAEFRDVLLHGDKDKNITGMDMLFNLERISEPVLDDKGVPKKDSKGVELTSYSESEGDFFKRIVATHKITEVDLQKLADVVNASLVFDPSAAERKPAQPKKLATKYSDIAKKLIAGGKIDELNKRFHKTIGKMFTASGDKAKDIEALGWLVKEFSEENERQAMAKLVA